MTVAIFNRRASSAVILCASFAVAAAASVLLGWTCNITWLKSIAPGFVAMNPATALCFAAIGFSLWKLRNGAAIGTAQVTCQLLAATVTAVGSLRLLAYLFNFHFAVDRLLFAGSLADNRMAPNTAVCFLMLGVCMLLLDARGRRQFLVAQALALAVATVALVSLIGYAYGATSLYGVASYIPMALNTAAVFLVLSFGILLSRRNRGIASVLLHSGPGGAMARRLLPPVVLVPCVLGWLRLAGQHMGLYDTEMGAAFMVAVTVVLFVMAIGWIAAALNRADEERRNAAEELKRLNEQLEKRVVERTGQLAAANSDLLQKTKAIQQRDEKLRQAQKMEAVGTLAGGVAHEFNNLLQAIQGYARYAQDGLSEDEERYQDLQQVLEASRRAATLTKQLLGFGRRQVLELSDLDPNVLVLDLVKMLRPLIGEHIKVDLKLGESVGCLHADASQVQQLVMNLCINARDAMPDGGQLLIKTEGVELSESYCEVHPNAKPGSYVLLTVADSGAGIPPEAREHIFEPFFTTKGVGVGTGLGLAMVYGVVQQHGGAIQVYSEVGSGTTFKVYLPAIEVRASKPNTRVNRSARGGSETILIAEDDPMVRDLAVRIVSKAGYRTITANDGVEAVQLFEANCEGISLALLDVVMPRLGGRDAYRQMRSLRPSLQAVFCSGYDPEMAHVGFVMEENLRLIQKPFDPELLLDTIRELLDQEACQSA